MTKAQEEHLQLIKLTFAAIASVKYEKGSKEHGGNLLSMTPLELMEEAREECIDQFVFIQTAIEKLRGQE